MNEEDLQKLTELVDRYGENIIYENIKSTKSNEPIRIIQEWKSLVKTYFGVSPFINYGKCIKIIRTKLKQINKEKLISILEYYCIWYMDGNQKYPLDISMALSDWFINKYLVDKEQY